MNKLSICANINNLSLNVAQFTVSSSHIDDSQSTITICIHPFPVHETLFNVHFTSLRMQTKVGKLFVTIPFHIGTDRSLTHQTVDICVKAMFNSILSHIIFDIRWMSLNPKIESNFQLKKCLCRSIKKLRSAMLRCILSV